jgi:hypothetical protein
MWNMEISLLHALFSIPSSFSLFFPLSILFEDTLKKEIVLCGTGKAGFGTRSAPIF